MKCPYCGFLEDRVVDSREIEDGQSIRRRRQCLNTECGRRFTSRERIDEIPSMVIKKDGTRERFAREKLIAGLLKACEKRPVKAADIEAIADTAEQLLNERPDKEIPVKDLGALVMQELKKLDQVAYVRFASVYRDFRDVDDFVQEARALRGSKE
jgi:transcriptional repressor NrdR